jgi:hypothetical protein
MLECWQMLLMSQRTPSELNDSRNMQRLREAIENNNYQRTWIPMTMPTKPTATSERL